MKSIRVVWTDNADRIEELCEILHQDRMYAVRGIMKDWYEEPWKVSSITYAHFEGQILGALVVVGAQTGTWVPESLRRQHIGTLLYQKHREHDCRSNLYYYRHSFQSIRFYNAVHAPGK